MARTVYVTGLRPGGGKSAVALGVTELLSRQVARLAVFRPLVREAGDPILGLLRQRYPTQPAAGYAATYAEATALLATGGQDLLVAHVLDRFRAVTRTAEAVVVVIGAAPSRSVRPAQRSPTWPRTPRPARRWEASGACGARGRRLASPVR